MPSKGVLDRQRIGKAIVAAARTHAQEVGQRLNEDLTAIVAEGETLADFTTLQIHLGRYLQMRLDALVAADELHLQELDDDQDPRLRRDEAAETLYRKVIEIREAVSAAFGDDQASALVGIEGETSRDPLTLHRQARRVLERLRNPELPLPPQRLNGLQIDSASLAAELQPATDDLAQALADVDRELRETETSLGLKTEAMEALDRAVRGVGRILKGCDELAEFPNFAEKIRLSRTNRGGRSGTPEDEEEPPEGEELPPPGDEEPPASASALGFELPPDDEPTTPSSAR